MSDRWPVLAVVALLAVALPVRAHAQRSQPSSLSTGRVSAQIAVGTLLTPIAFFGAGWAAERLAEKGGVSDEASSRWAYPAAYGFTWLSAAAAPAWVGDRGRFSSALVGSAAGLAAGFAMVRVGNWLFDDDRRSCNVVCWTLGAAAIAMPSIGATVGYNHSRR